MEEPPQVWGKGLPSGPVTLHVVTFHLHSRVVRAAEVSFHTARTHVALVPGPTTTLGVVMWAVRAGHRADTT
jgi:hypothetical protein